MVTLNLKANTPEEQIVLQHLIPQVNDELAEKINNGVRIQKDGKTLINKKDLTTFMQYAMEEAKKQIAEKQRKGAQAVCVQGDDIMNWAIHYFEEDSIEGKLYNEDGTEVKPQKPKPEPAPVIKNSTPPLKKQEPQLNMFDMLSKDAEPQNNVPNTPIEAKPAPKKGSTMYQNYLAVKEKYNDCILFYRLGDFYEMFGDDAVTTAKELDLTLTGRDCGLDERVPMTGVPFHAADAYVAKLVKKNYKVAICEYINGENIVDRVITKQPEANQLVDVQTGEILSDDIDELLTVSKLIGDIPNDEISDDEPADDELSEEATNDEPKENESTDEDDLEFENDINAFFDKDALYDLFDVLADKVDLI